MSFLARTAISVFRHHYRYYAFMKVWWKGALAFFLVWMLLLGIQYAAEQKMPRPRATLIHFACLFLALCGLYYTYHDFRSELSHRWAGERLHLGFYLFWIGWVSISAFILYDRKKILTDKGSTGEATP
jgi:hypothetical protein